MKTKLTLLVTKLLSKSLKLIKRGGSFPGSVALKLQPDLLKHLSYPKQVIVVTGTNGKTTTTNMLYDILVKANYRVVANLKGDNLKVGVSALCATNANLKGEIQGDILLLEVDELNVPKVLADIPVTTLVVNNFFRDQLDRSGEMESVISKIEKGIQDHFNGTLILNGDDPNVVRLARFAPAKYFGVERNALSKAQSSESSEGKFCVFCHQPIKYEFYQYSHIGRFSCECGKFGNVAYDLLVEAVDVENGSFKIDDTSYQVRQLALYYFYNCAALALVSKQFNIDTTILQDVFANFDRMNGRNEKYQVNSNQSLTLNLVKNPTGTNEVLKLIQNTPTTKTMMIILNDNAQDGTDVSWIWDAQFERLSEMQVDKVICTGLRAYDLGLRLKYASTPINFEVISNVDEALSALFTSKNDLYVVSTYTALQSTRALIKKRLTK